MNYFGELLSEGFLTKQEYQDSKFFDANIYQTKSDLSLEVSADICQSEPKKAINLRSGPKQIVQIPKKKIGSPPKQPSNQTREKRVDQGDPDKVVEVEEVNKNVHNFNFENELCKIKNSSTFY